MIYYLKEVNLELSLIWTEDNPIMKSDSLKRLILNLMLKSKGLDDED